MMNIFQGTDFLAAVEEHIKEIGIGAIFDQFPFTLTTHDRKDAPNWVLFLYIC